MLKLHIIFYILFLIMPRMTQNHVFSMNIAAAITEHHFLLRKISTKETLPNFILQIDPKFLSELGWS